MVHSYLVEQFEIFSRTGHKFNNFGHSIVFKNMSRNMQLTHFLGNEINYVQCMNTFLRAQTKQLKVVTTNVIKIPYYLTSKIMSKVNRVPQASLNFSFFGIKLDSSVHL